MARLPASLLMFVALVVSPAGAQSALSQADLLRRLFDLERLSVAPPAGEAAWCFSSWDRRQLEVVDGRYKHWDADGDAGNFLRADQDGWQVMAELNQPGAITRIWCEKPAGKLRITLDGATAIECEMSALFAGKVAPFAEPLVYLAAPERGGTLVFPIGFAQRCTVSCQGYADEYQVDLWQAPGGAAVSRFASELDEAAQAALLEVRTVAKRGLSDKQILAQRKTGTIAAQDDLAPGAKLTAEAPNPGVIRAFYLSLSEKEEPREPFALRNFIVRVFFDDAQTPAVEAPLPDLFGAGFERDSVSTIPIGTDHWITDFPGEYPLESWFMYCYYPMPFRKNARVEIENVGKRKLGLLCQLRVERAAPADNALFFHAQYRKEDPCKTFDFPLLETQGRGRLIGAVLSVDCPRRDWWGRGDHKIWIDRQPAPAILGTSTSGFFGSTSGLAAGNRLLSGVSRTAPFGKSSLHRFLALDSIPFSTGVKFTIENWQAEQLADTYYSSVAYWYSDSPEGAGGKPLKAADVTPHALRIPGIVELESSIVSSNWGNVLKERDAGVELSGGAAAVVTSAEPLDIDISVSKAGRYQVQLRAVQRRTFDTVTLADAGGKLVGVAKFSTRNPEAIYDVGVVELAAGRNKMKLTCSKTAYLDGWILELVGAP